MITEQRLKKVITILLDGNALMIPNAAGDEYEHRYFRKGTEVIVDDLVYEIAEHGIFKKCGVLTPENNYQKPTKETWMRICNLDEVDWLFEYYKLTDRQIEDIILEVIFVVGLKKSKK